MAKFVACLVMLAICMSVVCGRGHEGNEEPERCCLPDDQFTIKKSSQSGIVPTGFFARFRGQLAVFEESYMAFDYINNRIAAFMVRRKLDDMGEQHIHIIANLTTGMAHVMSREERKCSLEFIQDVPFAFERCIPDIAMYGGNHTFFDTVIGDTWTIYLEDMRRARISGLYTMTVNHETCVPFGETFAGKSMAWGQSQQIVTSAAFLDYKKGITEEEMMKYFTVPDFCKGNEMDHEMGQDGGMRPDGGMGHDGGMGGDGGEVTDGGMGSDHDGGSDKPRKH